MSTIRDDHRTVSAHESPGRDARPRLVAGLVVALLVTGLVSALPIPGLLIMAGQVVPGVAAVLIAFVLVRDTRRRR